MIKKMTNIKKCSFDFDSTLSLESVRDFAKELVNKGVEVHITTSRGTDREINNPNWNKDVWDVVKYCGIKPINVHFTNYEDKWVFIKDQDFLWHLDDDVIELSMISDFTSCTPICHFDWGIKYGGQKKWKEKCLNILEF